MNEINLILGDCLEVMKPMADNSIDTVITDPPYGLRFMGKEWDDFKIARRTKSQVHNLGAGMKAPTTKEMINFQQWFQEVVFEMLRIAKPGATLLCFGGTRTYHRLACAIEDAGWIIKDCIMWIYGQGFPKATDISKKLDKLAGKKIENKSEFTEFSAQTDTTKHIKRYKKCNECGKLLYGQNPCNCEWRKYKGQSEEAKLWNGWKSHGLKPAYEPILVAMKSNEGSYAENALKYGVAGLNIDEARIPSGTEHMRGNVGAKITESDWKNKSGFGKPFKATDNPQGRFPANIILECICDEVIEGKEFISGSFPEERGPTAFFGLNKKHSHRVGQVKDTAKIHTNPECPCAMLDRQSGTTSQGHWSKTKITGYGKTKQYFGIGEKDKIIGGASRFFYSAKASKSERGKDNKHPTVKPLKLIEYLVKLTSMPNKNQIYLDPFLGSGTVGVVCKKLNFNFIGIEKEPKYFEIAQRRINQTMENLL